MTEEDFKSNDIPVLTEKGRKLIPRVIALMEEGYSFDYALEWAASESLDGEAS